VAEHCLQTLIVWPNSRNLPESRAPQRVSDKTAYNFYFSGLNPPAFSPALLFQKELVYAGADQPDRHRLGFSLGPKTEGPEIASQALRIPVGMSN